MNKHEYLQARKNWTTEYNLLSEEIRAARADLREKQRAFAALGWDNFWRFNGVSSSEAPGWLRYKSLSTEDQRLLRAIPRRELSDAQTRLLALRKKANEAIEAVHQLKVEAGQRWQCTRS